MLLGFAAVASPIPQPQVPEEPFHSPCGHLDSGAAVPAVPAPILCILDALLEGLPSSASC